MSAELIQAATLAERALQAGSQDPDDYATLGWWRAWQGDDASAMPFFRAALERSPNHPESLVGIAAILRRTGRLRDAVLHCDAAIKANPQYADAWIERGAVLTAGGSVANARLSYEHVLAIDPGNVAGRAGLAFVTSRDGDTPQARNHAKAALARDPANAMAAIALATMMIESGEAQDAVDLLLPLVSGLVSASEDRMQLLSLLGDAYGRLAKAETAFANYTRANDDFSAIHARHLNGRPSHREFIEQITAGIAKMNPVAWPEMSPDIPANAAIHHIFILGYPRSGTTLVENILASSPGVAALEEWPTLAAADMDFLVPGDGLDRFDRLSEAQLRPYRQSYWDKVATGVAAAGQVFVDMDPLKATRLPLIARLFPDAKVLLMRRDPRDVVWSCFRTRFALSNAALEFTTLERTALHYDAMMRLIDLARARLPLTIHEVDYHRLVNDFDNETKAMCGFAGLEWSEALRRFDRTARERGVSTASAGQVRRGLYDGRGQWEPYADHLDPVTPILRPWIEKFGYAD